MPRYLFHSVGLSLAVLLSVTMFAWMFWHVYNSFQAGHLIKDTYQRGEELRDKFTHLNRGLTLAARMAAATQQERWLTEHQELVARFAEAVDDTKDLGPLGYDAEAIAEAADIRSRLTEREQRSLRLARPETHDRAIALLTGIDYETLVAAFDEAIGDYHADLRERIGTRLRRELDKEVLSLGVAFAIFTVSLAIWSTLVGRLRRSQASLLREVAEHRLAEQQLRQSEQKYRGLFEGVNDSIFIVDPITHCVLDANENASARLGYTPDELRSLNMEDIAATLAEDPSRQISATLDATDSVVSEQVYKHKDGSEIPVEISSQVVDYQGRRVYQSVARDVTERRRLEEELRQAQKMEAIGQLAGGIAHDFSNLLTAISGYTLLAKSSLAPDHPARRSLERIELAAEQATGITRSLLTFSRRSALDKGLVELRLLVEKTARLLGQMLPTSVQLVVDEGKDAGVWVFSNAIELEQAVLNLAINARDAMPEGGTLTISLGSRQLPSPHGKGNDMVARPEAYISVADTGVGVPPEVQGRIFEPFFTTKPVGTGTGLGLSVVHGIVKDYGGRVEAQSKPGQGSVFTIFLPQHDQALSEPEVPEEETTASGSDAVILLVEDNQYVRELIATSLQNCGYAVVQTGDGLEFLNQYRLHRARTGMLIIDVDLPKRGGLDCLSDIRDQGDRLPAIVITGMIDKELEDRIDSDALLLRKPFPMSELCRLSSRMLGTQGGTAL